jgi:hypothetical protein
MFLAVLPNTIQTGAQFFQSRPHSRYGCGDSSYLVHHVQTSLFCLLTELIQQLTLLVPPQQIITEPNRHSRDLQHPHLPLLIDCLSALFRDQSGILEPVQRLQGFPHLLLYGINTLLLQLQHHRKMMRQPILHPG